MGGIALSDRQITCLQYALAALLILVWPLYEYFIDCRRFAGGRANR